MKKQSNALNALTLSLASALVCTPVVAVEAMSDDEMSSLVVEDPFGATASGGAVQNVDTSIQKSEDVAYTTDQNNQALANDPNATLSPTEQVAYSVQIGATRPEHVTTRVGEGIIIESSGLVPRVHIDRVIDNTGANRGAQTFQNLQINNTTYIHEFRN
jgi:hypothetical protein